MHTKRLYELLEHTADICVRVKAPDLKGLFKNTALAVFDIMAKEQKFGIKKEKKIKITQEAENLDELFINWLNEILSLSSAKELIFSDFKISKLTENNLEATLVGSDMSNYKVSTEIKAATYHDLKLERIDSGWLTEVILDV